MKNTTEYNFLDKSPDSVSDIELLSLITGKNSQNGLKSILGVYNNNMNDFKVNTTYRELLNHGITHSKAIALLASFQVQKRIIMSTESKRKVRQSQDCYEIMEPVVGYLPHEEFWIVLLNRSFKIKKKIKISQGGLSGTVIDVRIIGRYIIENFASAIFAVHNHPSGNNKPSDADITITRKIKETADMLDVQLLDHLIITSNGYYSFADEGIL